MYRFIPPTNHDLLPPPSPPLSLLPSLQPHTQTTMLASRRSRSTRPLPYPVRFAVLGGGSFGLALASVLGKKSIPVTILVRKEDVAEHINLHHRHPTYLSDIALAPTIRATTNPEEALKDASFIIHAVPVQYSRKFLEDIAPHVPKNTPIISTSKVRAVFILISPECTCL